MAFKFMQPFSARCLMLLLLWSYCSTSVLAKEWTEAFSQLEGNGYGPSEVGNPISVPGVESFYSAPQVPTVSARLPETAKTTLAFTSLLNTVFPNPVPSQSNAPVPAPVPTTPGIQPASAPILSASISIPPALLPTGLVSSSGLQPSGRHPHPTSAGARNSDGPPLAGAAAAGAGVGAQGADGQSSQVNVGSTIAAIIGIVLAVFVVFALGFFFIMRRRGRQTANKDPEISAPVVQSVRPYIRNASRASSVTLSDPPVLPFTRPVINPFLDPTPPLLSTPGLAITTQGPRESATYVASPTMTYVTMLDQIPISPVPSPPVIIRTMARKEETQTSAPNMEPLPENLGRLNQWLEENRRRSRMTASSVSASIIPGDPRS